MLQVERLYLITGQAHLAIWLHVMNGPLWIPVTVTVLQGANITTMQ